MDYYLLISTSSLILQLVILGLLIVSVGLKQKKLFRSHGMLMAASVVLHVISIVIVMAPSFGAIMFTATRLSQMTIALSIVHGLLGLTALVLGVWLVAAWRFRQSIQYCAPKKRVMDVAFASWVTALVLGILLYFILYLPLMT